VPTPVLRILQVFVILLIWLFFFRVIRAVWTETRPPKSRWWASKSQGNELSGRHRLSLEIVEPASLRGQRYEVTGETTIGRSPGCSIPLQGDAFVSNVHARIYPKDGELWVEDLGSTNGTYVNARLLQGAVPLHRGDFVQVGDIIFEMAR